MRVSLFIVIFYTDFFAKITRVILITVKICIHEGRWIMSNIDKIVDARGDQCPIPVVKTKKAIAELGNKGTVQVFVDNETAVQNVTKMGQKNGATVTSEKRGDNDYTLTLVLSGEAVDSAALEQNEACAVDARGNRIIAVSDCVMGGGDDVLGGKLMKAFIFAVTQQDTLPKAMIFYNGGAKLTVEGSESLEDLKSLEAQGVEIVTCGTCLDFYGIKDKLAVGTATNMYDIVERQMQAASVVRPT